MKEGVPAINVAQTSKFFRVPWQRRSIAAVQDLNLTVAPGEIYGLLGPNGSGKSTTLKMILGLVTPSRGVVQIFGRDSREVGSREAVGYLPEHPNFPAYLTGAEAIRFFGKLSGLHGAPLTRRVGELVEKVGLREAGTRRLSTYSKGMLQRVGLAQALVHRPRVVVLDEPTAGVDPAGVQEICALMQELRADGVAVLFSSHLLGQVQEVCDRVGILARGMMVREGTIRELLTQSRCLDITLRDASPGLLRGIANLAQNFGAEVVGQRPAQTTLERLFLEATQPMEVERLR